MISQKKHFIYQKMFLSKQKNRALLLSIMTLAGFDFYHKEWWHYQLFESKKISLLDKIS